MRTEPVLVWDGNADRPGRNPSRAPISRIDLARIQHQSSPDRDHQAMHMKRGYRTVPRAGRFECPFAHNAPSKVRNADGAHRPQRAKLQPSSRGAEGAGRSSLRRAPISRIDLAHTQGQTRPDRDHHATHTKPRLPIEAGPVDPRVRLPTTPPPKEAALGRASLCLVPSVSSPSARAPLGVFPPFFRGRSTLDGWIQTTGGPAPLAPPRPSRVNPRGACSAHHTTHKLLTGPSRRPAHRPKRQSIGRRRERAASR